MLTSNPKVVAMRQATRLKLKELKISGIVPEDAGHSHELTLDCRVCTNKFTISMCGFIQGKGCPACSKIRVAKLSSERNLGQKPTTAFTKSIFTQLMPKGYKLKEFVAHPGICTVLCENGHTRKTTANNILRYGCRECKGLKQSVKTHNEKLSTISNKVRCTEYLGSRSLSNYICLSCNFAWTGIPTNILKANRCVCPNCDRPKGSSVKTYKLGGRLVRVRGYEPQALDYIQKTLGYKAGSLFVDYRSIPKVSIKGRRPYVADIWIPRDRRLVEVKSLGTLGVNGLFCADAWKQAKAKRRACINQGFAFSLLVFNDLGKRIVFPKDWHLLTLRQAIKQARHQV